jgi:pimeloyl-ACP methyl ester carboxylesterase
MTTLDDHLMHYEVLGRGQPIIFIHGWLGSWRYWWPTMQGLSSQHRSFALDLWGFGDSTKATEHYSLTGYVQQIEKFIDKLGIAQPVTLVGHGLGGIVALSYAEKYPDLVKKLVLISIPVRSETMDGRLLDMDVETFVSRVLGKGNSFPEVDSELRKTDNEAVQKLAREIQGQDFYNVLANLPLPILLIGGGQDPIITPYSNGILSMNSASNRYIVPIENCSHFPMLEEKVKFNRLLLEFFHADASVEELVPKEFWQRRVR